MAHDDDLTDWKSIKLGEIFQLAALGEYGSMAKEVLKLDPSTFSRDINALERKLGLGDLTQRSGDQLTWNDKGKFLGFQTSPWLDFFARVAAGEISNLAYPTVRIGAGGSLAGWLIGARLPEIKKSLVGLTSPEMTSRVRIDVQSYRNGETLRRVVAGALDFGLVREGVVTKSRAPVNSTLIGTVNYHLYIPERMMDQELLACKEFKYLDLELEESVLRSKPIATVGPLGEFRRRLDDALQDSRIYPNIEYSYRAFTMLLPHMIMKTHVLIMPNITSLEGKIKDPCKSSVLGYRQFPLRLFSPDSSHFYERRVMLIYSTRHNQLAPTIDFEQLEKVLRFS